MMQIFHGPFGVSDRAAIETFERLCEKSHKYPHKD